MSSLLLASSLSLELDARQPAPVEVEVATAARVDQPTRDMTIDEILMRLARGIRGEVWLEYGLALRNRGVWLYTVGRDVRGNWIFEISHAPSGIQHIACGADGLWRLTPQQPTTPSR